MTRVLVLGAAVSGLAAARLALRLGWNVTMHDVRSEPLEQAPSPEVRTVCGPWDRQLLDDVDLVVASPGVPEHAPPIVDAVDAGIEVWSEIELAWRHLDVPVVAVTGTNGKTTVTSLTAEMLLESGRRAAPLGNIGTPLSDAVGRILDVAVVEVSSFQLRFTHSFRPHVAVVTNVAPDHLDWHGSFQSYAEAKRRIVANQTPDDIVIHDADDDGAARLVEGAAARHIPISGSRMASPDFGVDGETLVLGGRPVGIDGLKVDSPAFLFDLAAAAAAAVESGATLDAVESVARSFAPSRHRRTPIGIRGGVTFVDDSKATNPHAALASIDGFDSVVLIAGGLAKGLDITPLARHPKVRRLVAIGKAAPELLRAAGQRGTAAGSMDDAVRIAWSLADQGDTILLAPGCASFDMFEDYGRRGDAFADAFERLSAPGANEREAVE